MSFIPATREEYNSNQADSGSNTTANASISIDSEKTTPNASTGDPVVAQSTLLGTAPPLEHATVTSSTASHQHQQQQEMLSGFAIPKPPVSTQQSSVAAEMEQGSATGQPDSPRTLWMGDLDPWLDEAAIADLWWQVLHKKVNVKIIKPKTSKPELKSQGLSHSGYCFVEFETFEEAQQALALNGQLLPDIAMPSQQQFPNNPDNQKKYFRLNWASGATLSAPIVQTPEYSLFVGDLSASTTEAHLLAFFQKSFPTSIKTVRVMTDPVSGKSRCFGFVRFTDELERQRALVEMHGAWFGGRPLRVALATPRNAGGKLRYPNIPSPNFFNPDQGQQMFIPPNAMAMSGSPFGFYGNPQMAPPPHPQVPAQSYSNGPPMDIPISNEDRSQGTEGQPNFEQHRPVHLSSSQQAQSFADPNNTTVFIGGLSSEVTEQTLFTLFKPFGIIQQVKIPPGKNCGFIKYSSREEAEEAIAAMQGFIISGNRVRLSWGRVSMNNKKFHQQQQQVAHAAQMQAATALSMGMDPASAIAAAAAAAAGGFPPHMPGAPGHPHTPGMPIMRGMPPMGIPPHISMQAPGNMTPSSPNAHHYHSSSEENDNSFEKSSVESNDKPLNEMYTHKPGISPQAYMGGPPTAGYNMPPAPHNQDQESLVSSMGNMNLQGEDREVDPNSKDFRGYQGDHRFMMPPMFNGGYPVHDIQYQQFIHPQQIEQHGGFQERTDHFVNEDENADKNDNEKNKDNDE